MLSVIVPVYNTSKYLRRCFDALTGQTIDHSQFEIIIVNDGSTDDSPEIIAEYAANFPDIIKVYDKFNGGQATARNLGIKMARGEYVGFADSDDYVDISMFDKMYKLALLKDADLVECHYHSMLEVTDVDSDSFQYKEIDTRGTIKAHEDTRELFLNPQVSPWNKLYRRSVLVDNGIVFPEGMIYEDTAFYIKALPFIKKHAYLDEKLVYYSVRQNSTMTGNSGSKVGDIFKVLDDILEFYRINGLYGNYKKELEFFCVKIAFCSNLSRIGRIKNSYIRREMLDRTFEYVRKRFPDYKRNEYFTGKIGIYIKSVCRANSVVYAKVLSKVMIG